MGKMKTPATALYGQATKADIFFDETKAMKMQN